MTTVLALSLAECREEQELGRTQQNRGHAGTAHFLPSPDHTCLFPGNRSRGASHPSNHWARMIRDATVYSFASSRRDGGAKCNRGSCHTQEASRNTHVRSSTAITCN